MHPSDARIQALIDGEMDLPRAAGVLAHLESCATCRDRQRALEFGLAETARLIASLEQPAPSTSVDDVIRLAEGRTVPARVEGRNLLRAASLAGLLIAGAVAAAVVPGPVRDAVERIVRGPAEEDAAPAPVSDPWRQETGVALVPIDALEITFEDGQAEGFLELIETGGDTARVEVRSDSVGFVVGDGAVLVQNRGSRASYRVAIPSGLPRVRIMIGPRTVYEAAGGEVLRDEFPRDGGARRLPLSGAP
jgi:hypothetical protein